MSPAQELVRNYAEVRARLMGKPPKRPIPPKPQNLLPVAKPRSIRRKRDFLFIPNATEFESRLRWKPLQHEYIMEEVMTAHGVTRDELIGCGQAKKEAGARDEVAYRFRNELGYSLPMIGKVLNRHHTSILIALRRQEAKAITPQKD